MADYQPSENLPLTHLNRKEARVDAVLRAFAFLVVVLLLANTSLTTFEVIQDRFRIEQNRRIQAFIKDQAVKNGRLSLRNKEILQAVLSCTKPGGRCYDDGQARTAKAVGSINEVTVAAAACAVGKEGTVAHVEAQIKDCINVRLGVGP